MKAKFTIVTGIALLVASTSALAAYTRTSSPPVYIRSIYANEAGSPFVIFATTVSPACGGMYLYSLESGNSVLSEEVRAELRKNKMAILLAAKLAEKRVVLDYFVDPSISGWAACYIHGLEIVD